MTRRSGYLLGAFAVAVLATLAVLVGQTLSDDRDSPADQAHRNRMVSMQIESRDVTDAAVLHAMRTVPRHLFVPAAQRFLAYDDTALPIGDGQTISQPYIVALMTAAIHPRKEMRVLEVGTGSGYQAAVLASCVGEVDSIEVIPALGHRAASLVKRLGYKNVRVWIGDGFDGWPERAPFDAILLTAAPDQVPQPLLEQLKVGGRLVAPLGRDFQQLVVITKTPTGNKSDVLAAVRFVPMTGKASAEKRVPVGKR
jgi:protein-L-isoaspartate(D-aspartate) O-methyltransferase